MYKFNKILVGLDLSDLDKDLILSAAKIAVLSQAKEIHFVNVIRNFNVPDELTKEFPDLINKAVEDRRDSIEKEVKKFFVYDEAKVLVNVLIEQGPATKTLMRIIHDKKIDLIVLGRKKEKKVGGVLVSRIARRASCSLLILPQNGLSFKNIFVPTDFSNYSRKALEKATTLARRAKENSNIIVQNVYQVPTGYHYTGKSFKEFSEIMKENAKKDFARFASGINTKGLKIEEIYTNDKSDDVISMIYKTAKKIKADIIILGAKGQTSTASMFIGSKAEKLVHLNTEIPMLMIRPKGKVAGFIEAIQEL